MLNVFIIFLKKIQNEFIVNKQIKPTNNNNQFWNLKIYYLEFIHTSGLGSNPSGARGQDLFVNLAMSSVCKGISTMDFYFVFIKRIQWE